MSRRESVMGTRAIAALCFSMLFAVPATAFASWWNNDWSYRKEVLLDGTAQGAGLKVDLNQMPVLIRLHDGVFRFTDANADGSDLRFVADDDKTPLKYYIEKYDSVFNLAFVWVAVPRLSASQPVKLWMYYGNSKAANESDARALYDPGQVLVYHFADRSSPGADATALANNAVTTPPLEEDGLIGNAARLAGADKVLTLPPAGALALTAGMSRTVMMWLKPAAAQTSVVLEQGDATGGIRLGLNQGIPYITVATPGAAPQTAAASAALPETWQHVAVVSSASRTDLYINGEPGVSIPVAVPPVASAPVLGQAPAAAALQAGATGFAGLLDELSIANVEREAAYVRVAALNQGASDRLVRFGADEALSTWQSGYFAIILKSVTMDGWVVIGILGLMSVISIVVMVRKVSQIGRVSRANGAFLELFKRARGDFVGLSNLLGADAPARDPAITRLRKLALQAPLCHVFSAGVEELRERLREEAASGSGGRLSSESIEAIRATLDASIVDENQSLNSQMVLLTIAISGGPFLGLLGTVVGVMITFAAIAAAGDVNINAIAPGIAAALVATVAGLVVAIPALFGYNYLTTRINNASARMHVFLDTFITRMAESHNHPPELRAAKAQG